MHSFMNELYVMRTIKHVSVLECFGVYETESSFLIVTELLRGGNLLEYLLTSRERATKTQTQAIMRGILEGLAVLQDEGVIHRDIKL